MKYEWKKKEKSLYLPPAEPVAVAIPAMNFFMVDGKGNPNDEFFAEYIQALYSLSYGVRMSEKGGYAPEGYFDYTVYPLEGVWDLSEEGRESYRGKVDKDELVFTLMMRQPGFVTPPFAEEVRERTKRKKPHPLLDKVRFETLSEGRCVQMMHLGAYDGEPASFERMGEFCVSEGLTRKEKTHREIYISDPRRTEADKLKTVLRFRVG